MSSERPDTVILWDSVTAPPEADSRYCTWNGHGSGSKESEATLFLLEYCEANAERLRAKYVRLIRDIGNSELFGKRIVEHLALDAGFSFWWMTTIAEKSKWKSPSISDAIRLLALEEILLERQPKAVRFATSRRLLHESVSALCHNLDIRYEWQRIPTNAHRASMRKRVYGSLPHPLRAIVALIGRIAPGIALRRSDRMAWKKEADSLFFCSYFFNLEPAAAAAGNYSSRYWGKLNGLLATIGLRSNWLELYMPQPVAQDAGSAASLVERFNARNNAEFHAFLDSFLSVEIVFLVLRRWLSLLFLSFRLREIERAFTPAGSAVSLWRIMKSDWIASTRGHVAVDGLFFFELFRKALQCVPRQRKGFYLFENQAWEKAMIHAWNESGHGELLAVPHSTRSFWDLRFTRDREEPLSSLPYDEPRPRQVVVNGRMSFEAFVADNYPREELVEGEALRYQHLNAARRARASQPSPEGKLRVLVLGDFTSDGTAALLRLLDETIPLLEFDASWTLKPHPSLPVDVGRFPWLSLDTSRRSLAEMLLDFDVAYASNATSAAVDAYIAGLQVVVILDDSELNFSPLRGNPEVGFAGTTRELAELFADARVKRSEIPPREDVFFLDPELPRWRHLLESTN